MEERPPPPPPQRPQDVVGEGHGQGQSWGQSGAQVGKRRKLSEQPTLLPEEAAGENNQRAAAAGRLLGRWAFRALGVMCVLFL